MWYPLVFLLAVLDLGLTMDYDVDIDDSTMSCEDAKLKCAYRVGCGMALQNYLVSCSSVLQGPYPNYCPEVCLYSLIALTSTKEGQKLMSCDCSDEFCRENKRRVEICRPQVTKANRKETVVSCKVAQWICAADSQCSTALSYYNKLCKSMFHGKKCNKRCKNSISILQRQEQAAKLKTCRCDGLEDFDCLQIQQNMVRLCSDDKHHFYVGTNTSNHNEVLKKRTDPSSSGEQFGSCWLLAVFLLFLAYAT